MVQLVKALEVQLLVVNVGVKKMFDSLVLIALQVIEKASLLGELEEFEQPVVLQLKKLRLRALR
jgi:hypothetical protein